jgi:Uma2 family endonuclease
MRMTPEEYLSFERASDVKHEYADGEVFAMSGGTVQHSSVAVNITVDLGVQLRGRRCRALNSDMRIKTPTGRYFYPDGSVVCGPPELEGEAGDVLLNPKVIIEVLSDSTEGYDRGDKFEHYRSLASLEEYVLASQKAPRIEVFTRHDDGSWTFRAHGPGETVRLSSIGCDLAVDSVYLDVFEKG